MPSISEFFGIVITMYFNDHSPPHFHVHYGGEEAKIGIDTLEIIKGKIPRRVYSLVLEWATSHRQELNDNWERARQGKSLRIIKPLL